MMTAKLFENGRSQAVRLPKEFRFEGDEVMIGKVGDIVVLSPKADKWDLFMKALDMFSDDVFENGRGEQIIQERENL
ncbi:MAG: antitoxin [Lachnospiraceae bacterium]|nr:antitoxin [Lachnospiraceae bacterium]